MRRCLFAVLSVCLASTAFAQTPGSHGGLVLFETFSSDSAGDPLRASVLASPMTTHTVLFATSSVRLSRNLGVAVVNPGDTATNVVMTLHRGDDGTVTSAKTITVNAREQVSQFISDIFADVSELPVDFDGTLSITSDTPVAVVALRFRGEHFSSIPITNLSSPLPVPQISEGVGGTGAVILPQLAAGGGWSSEIVLLNTTPAPLTVRIDLFKQDGTPLTISLNGASGSSFPDVVIPAEGIVIGNADDTEGLQVGYAVVTPPDAPTVLYTDPANLDTGVALNKTLSATFSRTMDPSTITDTTFLLTGPGVTPVGGAVAFDLLDNVATFTPNINLTSSATYTATITTGATDLDSNALADDVVWTFDTVDTIGPAAVTLGAAAPYAILAGAGVTNSGLTFIGGSLGTSPTGTLTGSPFVSGSIDLANDAAAEAKLALTAAFVDAAGRTVDSISLPGELDGLTLAPGLYTNSSSVMLSGSVTLDAMGDANATWIFQMGSTLTTFTGTQVILAGGAKAANIYWQVGSSATLGGSSIFKGNILAEASISLDFFANVEGRLLTQTGEVTLLENFVQVPIP